MGIKCSYRSNEEVLLVNKLAPNDYFKNIISM
jgi:hypothetical protein